MEFEGNRDIAKRFIQIWGDGDLDRIEELAHPDITVTYPILPRTIKGSRIFRRVMEGFRSSFPDSRLTIDEEIAEGDRVVIRWTFHGTHSGQLLNYPATGRKVTWTGITIYEIVEGKVIREMGEEDFLGFLRQTGIVE